MLFSCVVWRQQSEELRRKTTAEDNRHNDKKNKYCFVTYQVHEAVCNDGKVDITGVSNIGVHPVDQENGSMMVYMKERQLSPLHSKDDYNGIPEVQSLNSITMRYNKQ